MKTFDNINDLNDFKTNYPLASEYLWGRQTNYGLAMPECYMGDDMRGYISLGVNCHRISQDILAVSNYQCWIEFLKELDPKGENDNWLIASFSSWVTPYESILVKSNVPYLDAIEAKLKDLQDYPVFSDDHYSELEWKASEEIWANMSLKERVEMLQNAGENIFQARHEYLPTFHNGSELEWINPDHTI